MSSYKQQLLQQNMAQAMSTFLFQRGGGELELTLRCALSKCIIQMPVRHQNIVQTKCIYELEEWIKYYNSKSHQEQNDSFKCPGCKEYVRFAQFGIDYPLVQQLKLLNMIDPKQQTYKRDKMIIDFHSHKYYAISAKNKDHRLLIPGCVALISRNAIGDSQSAEEMALTLQKLRQYILTKKIQKINKEQKYSINQVNDKLSKCVSKVVDCVKKNMNLYELGMNSINKKNVVFALKKVSRNNSPSSILVVYYTDYNIWLDFDLQYNGKPFVQKEAVLYIKDTEQPQNNYIYIIGGSLDQYDQTDEFLRIAFPKDPFTTQRTLQIEKLKNLIQPGYNFMGTIYQNKIYIFYGQQKQVNSQKCVTDVLLNSTQVFSNGNWSNLQTKVQILPRFDGSCFTIDHSQAGKCILFYGGLKKKPDGLVNWAGDQQNQGQIFQCSEQQFIGNYFSTYFPNYKGFENKVINSPIFSIPHYGTKQLLISGEFMRENMKGKRQIFSFDWASGEIKFHSIFSIEPPEQILTPYYNRTYTSMQLFTPVQDEEGVVVNNIFYTIYQEEEQQSQIRASKTQLLKINLTNGLFTNQHYKERSKCQEQAKERLSKIKLDKCRLIPI